MDQQSRTYLFARLWEDYSDTFVVTKYEGFPDPNLGEKLDRVAATWIRKHLGDPKTSPIAHWAVAQPEPAPEILASLDDESQTALGIQYMVTATNRERTPRHPIWQLIHAVPSLQSATDITTTLEQAQKLGFPFQIAIVRSEILTTTDRLLFERELEDWEKVHFDLKSVSGPGRGLLSPLKRLREEAVKFSRIYDTLMPASHPGTVVATKMEAKEVADAGGSEVREIQPPPSVVGAALNTSVLQFELNDPDRKRRTHLKIRYGHDREGRPQVVTVRGSTQAHLLKMVIEQPDYDHDWAALVRTGNKAGFWLHTSTGALKKAGQRIKETLPPTLKGHWNQSEAGVRWDT